MTKMERHRNKEKITTEERNGEGEKTLYFNCYCSLIVNYNTHSISNKIHCYGQLYSK